MFAKKIVDDNSSKKSNITIKLNFTFLYIKYYLHNYYDKRYFQLSLMFDFMCDEAMLLMFDNYTPPDYLYL